MSDLYDALLERLRADVAAAMNECLRVGVFSGKPVKADEIITFQIQGTWYAKVDNAPFDVGPGCLNATEALCRYIDCLRRDAEAAGGDAPRHLIDQLEAEAASLAAFRHAMPRLLAGKLTDALDALDRLDQAAARALVHALEGQLGKERGPVEVALSPAEVAAMPPRALGVAIRARQLREACDVPTLAAALVGALVDAGQRELAAAVLELTVPGLSTEDAQRITSEMATLDNVRPNPEDLQ